MTGSEAALLSLAAAMGGAMNAVAGGGSFLTFPALVFAGMPPIVANATSTVALWPGSVASVAAYRRELAADRRTARVYGLAALLGGVAGALLLVRTPPGAFARLVPWLLLLATVTFSFGGALRARLGHRAPARRHAGPTAFLVQLAITVSGGHFGGGRG
ncbi:MAG: sulfite exporter TauE/SafE family protein, partial [Myxococcales bacterium]